MNRRNFFKVVTGFVAGIFASSVEGKKFSTEDFGGWNPKDGWSAGIDPESEWVKHGQRALDFQKALNEVVKEKLVCYGQNGTLCPRCKFNNCHFPTLDFQKALNEVVKEKLVCVTPNSKRYIKWVRKEYPQYS